MTEATSAVTEITPLPSEDPDYWFELLTTKEAAKHKKVTVRKLEQDRQNGVGCKFIRLSARCIRYRRIDVWRHAEECLRKSTSDTGAKAA